MIAGDFYIHDNCHVVLLVWSAFHRARLHVSLPCIGNEGISLGNPQRGLWLQYAVGAALKGCFKFRGNS